MTIKRNGTPTRYVFLHNGERLKKAYHNGTKEIWSAGSVVTYVVDTDKTYTEEVDYGATCLAPTTFTPEKSGWEFIGWREDTTASSDVLTGKVMGSDAITLYAVYTQGADISFVFDNKTHSMTSFRYCNASGDTRNATISVPYGEDYSGWTWRGWSNANVTTADGEVFTNGGGAITDITSDSTYYGLYTQTIECSFVSRNSTQKVTGTKYHSASGDTVNATINTPVGADYSGYTWRGWSVEGDTVADSDVAFVNNDTISDLSSGGTYYGLYQKNITLTVVIDSARMNYNGKLYYNASGSSKLPTFTVADPSKDGYIFVGWGATEDSTSAVYDNITDLAIASNRTLYAIWIRDTVTLFDTNDNETETRRWYRKTSANNGWGLATCQINGTEASWNRIDCTDFNRCVVRIKGNIESTPSMNTVNHTYIKIGFTEDSDEAVEVVKKSANSDATEVSQSGLAYNKWYDLEIDVSALTGMQTLNVFIGGSYQNGGYLHCSKIVMSN